MSGCPLLSNTVCYQSHSSLDLQSPDLAEQGLLSCSWQVYVAAARHPARHTVQIQYVLQRGQHCSLSTAAILGLWQHATLLAHISGHCLMHVKGP